jgi:hypothetical protein
MPAATVREETPQGRFYTLPDGSVLPSVTSILRAVAKPALVSWAARVERELCVESAANLFEDIPFVGKKMSRPAYITTLLTRIGKQQAHHRALAKAGDVGTQVHARIEWTLRAALGQVVAASPPPLSPPAVHAFAQWEDWRRSVALTPQMIEQVVWSRADHYAGTLDLFGVLEIPELGPCFSVLDWKTNGKRIYPEAGLQIAAYGAALAEMGHVAAIPHGVIVRLPKTADDTLEVTTLAPVEMEQHLAVFLAVVRLAAWVQAQTRA